MRREEDDNQCQPSPINVVFCRGNKTIKAREQTCRVALVRLQAMPLKTETCVEGLMSDFLLKLIPAKSTKILPCLIGIHEARLSSRPTNKTSQIHKTTAQTHVSLQGRRETCCYGPSHGLMFFFVLEPSCSTSWKWQWKAAVECSSCSRSRKYTDIQWNTSSK